MPNVAEMIDDEESRLLTSVNRGEWTRVERLATIRARYARLASATLGRL